MARPRQSITRRRSPSRSTTATPSTTISPMFSNKTSEISETPDTSDIDEDTKDTEEKPIARKSTRSSVTATRKRLAEASSDHEESASANSKRRGTGKGMYIEIPTTTRLETPLKNKLSQLALNKRKRGKADPPPLTPKSEDDDGVLVSEDELDFVETQSLGESDDSGSAFEAESDDVDLDEEDVEEFIPRPRRTPRGRKIEITEDEDVMDIDEADDEILLGAAIKLSKQTFTEAQNAGGSSSGAGSSRHAASRTAAALRAAAAERRLAGETGLTSDDGGLLEPLTESEAKASSSEDEPLAIGNIGKRKAKGKGKAPAKKKAATVRDTSKPASMSMSEWRRIRKEARQAKALERRANRTEELEYSRKLGRKLTWAEKSTVALHKHHPELRDVWGDLEAKIEIVVPQKAEQPADLRIPLLPFQLESLYWMRKQEEGIWRGGMLADEMGMGKTIQTLALFVSDRQKPNLVVAPTVAIMQWRNEIEAHTSGFKVAVWHGASREANAQELKKFDVVLTTYAVLESAFRKQQSGFKRQGQIVKQKSPVHQIQWHRIILDEAHNIKERSTNTAKAAFELKSNYKWCLSGTPLQNRVGELYSLVRFLGGDPFSYYFCKKCDCKSLHWKFSDKKACDDCGHNPMQHTCFWNNEILTPIQKNGMIGPGLIAFKKLKILLDRMMLRRTKIERADDLGLPPRTVTVRRDYFSPEEKELYLSLFSDAKRQFTTYVDQGTLLNNYSNIFSLITRMRQMACHPDLVLKSKRNASQFTADEGEATVCRLCNDIAEDAIQSKCRHIFDRECIKQYINTAVEQVPACPVCHLPLTIDLEGPALELDQEATTTARQGILGRLDVDKWRSSSKIEALVEELTRLRQEDATTKSLVFSQFVNFLDLIAFRLQRAGFTICRLEGTMTPQARDATIQYFMNNVNVTVFLVSLKAGGVALNLTEANRVYLMDSWWNPAVEYQAMDRIHRLGQHRPVQAIKLVIEDSIESRIVQLQEKKSAMVDATLSTDDSAMGRLTPDDLGFLFRL